MNIRTETTNAEQRKSGRLPTATAEGACGETRARPKLLSGCTVKMKTGCGALYVTVNRLGDKFYELFVRAGKAGGCAASQCEAIGRLISLAWRKGANAEEVIDQLKGISCQLQDDKDPERADSCADGVAKAIKAAEPLRESGTTSESHEKEKCAKQEKGESGDERKPCD